MEQGVCPECEKKIRMQGVYSAEGSYQRELYQGNGNVQYPSYQKPQKKNQIWLGIGIGAAVLILLLMIIGSFFYGYILVKYAAKEDPDAFLERPDFAYEEEAEEEEASGAGKEADVTDEYDDAGKEDYVPSPEDEYYYGPCDAIDDTTAYSFADRYYTYEDSELNVDIVIHYLELRGDSIPNVEQLNQAIKKEALYYVEDFSDAFFPESCENYEVYTTSYVTYNDEDMVSIVMDEYVAVDTYFYRVDLYPINIDVKNGVILDNNSILEIDEEFAAKFRSRNQEQNGSVEYVDALSDEALADQLKDKNSVIAYYTPLGMEVGINYNTDGNSGWVTVTYKDYEKYLAKF